MSHRFRGIVFWLLVALGVCASVLVILTTLTTGVGWDSGIDTAAAIQVRQLPDGIDLKSAYGAVYSTSEFYGILVQSLADSFRHLAGASGFSEPSDLITYRLQGLVTVSFAILAAAISAVAVGTATRSRLAGAFTWSVALTPPLVMGLVAIDFKDSPLASGLLGIASGLCLVSSLRRRGWAFIAGMFSITFGVFVSLGVRAGSLPLVVALIGISVIVLAIREVLVRDGWRLLATVGAAFTGGALGIVCVYVLNPLARISMPHWLIDAYLTSKSFPWEGTIRVFGQDVDAASLPWWYVPAWFIAQTPVVVTLAVVVGVASWANILWCGRRNWRVRTDLALTPFFVQAFILPIGIVVSGAVLYDGIRHLLFAVCALPAVMACTMAWAESRPWKPRGVGRWVPVLLLVVPIVSLVADTRWFPYQYAHLNPVAAHYPGERPFELDYWGVSVIEASERLRALGADQIVALPELSPLGTAQIAGTIPLGETRATQGHPVGVYTFRRWDSVIPNGCRKAFVIARAGLVLGEGALCDQLGH